MGSVHGSFARAAWQASSISSVFKELQDVGYSAMCSVSQ